MNFFNYKKVRCKAGSAAVQQGCMTSELALSGLFPVPAPAVMSHRLLFKQEQFNLCFLISIILIIQIFLNWNVVSISVHRWIRYELRESCKCEFCIICGDFQFLFFIFGFVCFVDLFIVSESTRIEMNRSI